MTTGDTGGTTSSCPKLRRMTGTLIVVQEAEATDLERKTTSDGDAAPAHRVTSATPAVQTNAGIVSLYRTIVVGTNVETTASVANSRKTMSFGFAAPARRTTVGI